ncbi:Kinesin-like protein KIF21B [Smittium mucronatum]|uniref:Kinesin-like protein KIF21B n=1 Tax=Smittium mucronatum TaxID=133383 RepID=A0A1R0GYW4_9FUNG|nr:Kinesin-like protein KIF21B [Smittium mucronatum]
MSLSQVKVALRVKPISKAESDKGERSCINIIPGTNQISIGTDRSFTFDYVFSDKSTQIDIYDKSVKPLVEQFLNGYNSTIMAYGQTGSGKTYTMGTENSRNKDQSGMIPRAFADIFSFLDAKQNQDSNFIYQIEASFVELYNDEIYDLLKPKGSPNKIPKKINKSSKKSPKIEALSYKKSVNGFNSQSSIFKSGKTPNENYIWGNIEKIVSKSSSELLSYLSIGNENRTVGSTDMNLRSSRSHAIFTVTLTQQSISHMVNQGSPISVNNYSTQKIVSKIHFVDLAGSERIKQTNSLGNRMREGISINSGLLALGNVISALGDALKRQLHIPYRNSKLTRLLEDSLGGNSITLMLACITESNKNYNESLSTLRYANRTRNIKNKVVVSMESNPASEIVALKGQIQDLQTKIREQNESLKNYSIVEPKDMLKIINNNSHGSRFTQSELVERKKTPSPIHIASDNSESTVDIIKNPLESGYINNNDSNFHILALEKRIIFQNSEIQRLDKLLRIKGSFSQSSAFNEGLIMNKRLQNTTENSGKLKELISMNLESDSDPHFDKRSEPLLTTTFFSKADDSSVIQANIAPSKKSFSIFSKNNNSSDIKPISSGRKSLSNFFGSLGNLLANRKDEKSVYGSRSNSIIYKDESNKKNTISGDIGIVPTILLNEKVNSSNYSHSDFQFNQSLKKPKRQDNQESDDWEFVLDIISQQRKDSILLVEDLLEKYKAQSAHLSDLENNLKLKVDDTIENTNISDKIIKKVLKSKAVSTHEPYNSSDTLDVNESSAMIFKALIYSNINQCVAASKLLGSMDELMKRQNDLVESQNNLFTNLTELESIEKSLYESKDPNYLKALEPIEVKIYSVQNKIVLIDSELSYLDLRIKDIELQLAEVTKNSNISYLKSVDKNHSDTKITNIDDADKINYTEFARLISQMRRVDLDYLTYLLAQAIVEHRISENGVVQDREKLREKVFSLQCELDVMRKVALNVASIYEKELFDTENVDKSIMDIDYNGGLESKYDRMNSIILSSNKSVNGLQSDINVSIKDENSFPEYSQNYQAQIPISLDGVKSSDMVSIRSPHTSLYHNNMSNTFKVSNLDLTMPISESTDKIRDIKSQDSLSEFDLTDSRLFHKISSKSNQIESNNCPEGTDKIDNSSSYGFNSGFRLSGPKDNFNSKNLNESISLIKPPSRSNILSKKNSFIRSPTPLLFSENSVKSRAKLQSSISSTKPSRATRRSSSISIRDVMKSPEIRATGRKRIPENGSRTEIHIPSYNQNTMEKMDTKIFGTISSRISYNSNNIRHARNINRVESLFDNITETKKVEETSNLLDLSRPSRNSNSSYTEKYNSSSISRSKKVFTSPRDSLNQGVSSITHSISLFDIRKKFTNDLTYNKKSFLRSSQPSKSEVYRNNSLLDIPPKKFVSNSNLKASSLKGRKYTYDGGFSAFISDNRLSRNSNVSGTQYSSPLNHSEIMNRVIQRGVFQSAVDSLSQGPEKNPSPHSNSRWSLVSNNRSILTNSSISKLTEDRRNTFVSNYSQGFPIKKNYSLRNSSDSAPLNTLMRSESFSPNKRNGLIQTKSYGLNSRSSAASFNSQTFSYGRDSFARYDSIGGSSAKPKNSLEIPKFLGVNNRDSEIKIFANNQKSAPLKDVNLTQGINIDKATSAIPQMRSSADPTYVKKQNSYSSRPDYEGYSSHTGPMKFGYPMKNKNSSINHDIGINNISESLKNVSLLDTSSSLDQYVSKLETYTKINRESRQLLTEVYRKIGHKKSEDSDNVMVMLEAFDTQLKSKSSKSSNSGGGYDSGVDLGNIKSADKVYNIEYDLSEPKNKRKSSIIGADNIKSVTDNININENQVSQLNSNVSHTIKSITNGKKLSKNNNYTAETPDKKLLYRNTNISDHSTGTIEGKTSISKTLKENQNFPIIERQGSYHSLSSQILRDSVTEIHKNRKISKSSSDFGSLESEDRVKLSSISSKITELVEDGNLDNFQSASSNDSFVSIDARDVKIMNFFPYPPSNGEHIRCITENHLTVENIDASNIDKTPSSPSSCNKKCLSQSTGDNSRNPVNPNGEKNKAQILYYDNQMASIDKDLPGDSSSNAAGFIISENEINHLKSLSHSEAINLLDQIENPNIKSGVVPQDQYSKKVDDYDTQSLSGMSEFSIDLETPRRTAGEFSEINTYLESNEYIKGSGLMSKIL